MSGSSLSLRRFALVISQQLLGTVLSILAGVTLANMLSTAAFGEFNAAYGVMMIVSTFAGLGASQFITVPFRRAIVSSEFALARGLRKWMPLCIIFSGIFAFGLVLTAHVVFGSNSAVRVQSFAAVLALVPLVALMTYLVGTANTHEAAGRAMFLFVPGLQLMILVGLGSVRLLGIDSFDVLDAAAVWAAANLVVCIALWRLNLVVERPEFKKGSLATAWRVWVTGAFPYLVSGVVNVTLIQAPFVVLGWIHANGENAAMFAAADRLAQLLSVAGISATAIFLPAIADAIEARSRQNYRQLIERWFLVVGSATGIGILFIVIFGETLLGLFGEVYRQAYWLLVVVSSSIGITMIASIFLSVTQYAGAGKSVIVISAIWTLAGLTAMVVLGEHWHTMGIALAQGGAFLGMYLTFVVRASVLMKHRLR
jgi:O-antigen/teichoic acid export membrane protein